MAKEEIDVQAERAKFLTDRQKKIDKAKEETIDEREDAYSQFSNPSSVRATDGGKPGTKERNPLEVAENAADEGEDDDNDGVPTKDSKVDEIKAYLDANEIDYTGVTKKDDLLALIV
ncbi:hypothetical protein [Dyadobacter sp. CY323]|uniref:hypothetical protein n=1 Tax=Dyadobacter sp. CY323 TaxID=2907302 RepID=UPI001F31AE81|nr:hypothetical protein [Dyadobacter sp. CY323]MCE6993059.1 hypothetical protein [Dyadobacter sp. CY323]